METENPKPAVNQVCTIHVGFPVTSDDEALAVKRKIALVVSDMPEARIEFSLISRPSAKPNGP